MHDWTLIAVHFDWLSGIATLDLRTFPSQAKAILAKNVYTIHVPRLQNWGPSSSINEVMGPAAYPGNKQILKIEMQSGDVIEIIADCFIFPSDQA